MTSLNKIQDLRPITGAMPLGMVAVTAMFLGAFSGMALMFVFLFRGDSPLYRVIGFEWAVAFMVFCPFWIGLNAYYFFRNNKVLFEKLQGFEFYFLSPAKKLARIEQLKAQSLISEAEYDIQ